MKFSLDVNKIVFLFVCFLKAIFLNSQQCNLIPFNLPDDESFCTCNKWSDVCDVDCCCDTKCNAKLFSKCLPLYPRNISQSCYKFIQSNVTTTKLQTKYIFSLFCIHKTNYLNPHVYVTPRTICNKEAVNKIPTEVFGYQFTIPSIRPIRIIGDNRYESGDVIQTVYEDSEGMLQNGVLTIPSAEGTCIFRPLTYKTERSSSCVSVFKSNFETFCRMGSLLDAKRYFKDFTISLKPFSDESDLSSINTVPVTPRRITCLGVNNEVITCPNYDIISPTYAAGMCRDAVKEVEYDIELNETIGIVRVYVSFVIQNITNNNLPYTQRFKTRFYQGIRDELMQRSSPSYVVGQPIAAGQIRSANSSGSTLYFVNVSSDVTKWITMATAGPDGRCSARKAIAFGTNMASGCFVEFSSNNISRTCANVSKNLIEIILPGTSVPSHVAQYANSDTKTMSTLSGWIPVQNNAATLPPAFSNNLDGCTNMVGGLNIEISFQRTGFYGNLTTEISKVTFTFTTQPSFRFPCPENNCEHVTTTKRAEIVTRVSFVDVSSPPMYRQLHKPRLKISLPVDFFYPLEG